MGKCECCGWVSFFCRFVCFKCCQLVKGKQPDIYRPTHSVLMIGLSQAGKSTLLAKLGSESTEDIQPTKGFSVKAVQLPKVILNVKELGGGEDVRGYWRHYYDGAEGVIFVVDSSSSEDDLDLAASELQNALSHPSLENLPVLVLANKQNAQGSRTVEKVKEMVNLPLEESHHDFSIQGSSLDNIDGLREILSQFVEKLSPTEDDEQDGYNRV